MKDRPTCAEVGTVAALEREIERLRAELADAWIAGYYHAGYTNDSAYATEQAELYVAALAKGE